tara:strand:+ start:4225 stop:4572 length:348 start_codon:yes stop_codon:yes gene_type:complete
MDFDDFLAPYRPLFDEVEVLRALFDEAEPDGRFQVDGTGPGLILRPGPRVPDPAHLLRDGQHHATNVVPPRQHRRRDRGGEKPDPARCFDPVAERYQRVAGQLPRCLTSVIEITR